MERLELTFVDLLFRIQLFLFLSHVSRTQYQSTFGLLVDEENHQVTASISPTKRFVHILSLSVSLFNKAELRATVKDLLNFVCETACSDDNLSTTSLSQRISSVSIGRRGSEIYKIRQQLLPFRGHDRFRMKLHAFDFELAMA